MMPVTYDGHLIRSTKPIDIRPCCDDVYRAILSGIIKVNKVRMYMSTSPGKIATVTCCPFCGAKEEVI